MTAQGNVMVPSCEIQPAASTSQPASPLCQPVQTTPAPVIMASDKLDKLTQLLSGFIENFTYNETETGNQSVEPSLSDGKITELDVGDCDPLDCLDDVITPVQTSGVTSMEDDDFQRALADLAGSFHGEEEQDEPISEKLANILNSSLRRRLSDDKVKATAAKIKLPSNVGNLKVPVTNNDITIAMSTGGKFLDARLTRTNCFISKAIVPMAKIVSDIGEKKNLPSEVCLSSLNDSLRLLAAAFNYNNHIRKEVARVHVNDSALAQLCKWECDVGSDELFPFNVAKKCDEIHKTKKLGMPYFK